MNFTLKEKHVANLLESRYIDIEGSLQQDKSVPVFTGTFTTYISEDDKNRFAKVDRYDDGTNVYFIKAIKFGYPGEVLVFATCVPRPARCIIGSRLRKTWTRARCPLSIIGERPVPSRKARRSNITTLGQRSSALATN